MYMQFMDDIRKEKAMTKRKSKLPEGMHELFIKGRKLPLIVQLQAIPVGYVVEEKALSKRDKPCIPEHGHHKFYVECERLDIYTAIGADNQHHASNKATKLFGPHWSCVSQRVGLNNTQYRTPKEFKELISTLPN
jgi:hypothetical protein